ncbi:MAG: sugar ABC transporter ATP-binding protein [Clostridium sp.]|nr:sugar ABC transporter ATP-binding protein [Clostridium sp.]
MDILKMKNISKAFFGVKVLNDVDFTVAKGEVHALLGENGAGKSTLMNILTGVHPMDSGSIHFNDNLLHNTSIKRSEEAGIAFVHQELNLFNDLNVYENLFLRKEILTKFHSLDKKKMIKVCKDLFDELGVEINPTTMVSELDTGKKQLLEISKALFANAQLIILDEPTTALNNEEIDHLFSIIRRLKEKGKSFIFISHKMSEIFDIADRYTILRNGKFIKRGNISEINAEGITKLMVGNTYSNDEIYTARDLGDKIVSIQELKSKYFNNISLDIKKGEVLAFTGLKGAGASELMQALFGVLSIDSGSFKVNDVIIQDNNIKKALKNKIAYIASNRKENSIIPDFSLLDNECISEHVLTKSKQHICRKKEIVNFNEYKKMLNIKCGSCDDLITSLSGGNQQKVIIARWLNTKADIILMDNPTQGIDVGAKAEIYKLILELSKRGKTIIVNTLEIPEIQKIADRCVVFYHGEIVKILDRRDITEENVMLYATNAINISKRE